MDSRVKHENDGEERAGAYSRGNEEKGGGRARKPMNKSLVRLVERRFPPLLNPPPGGRRPEPFDKLRRTDGTGLGGGAGPVRDVVGDVFGEQPDGGRERRERHGDDAAHALPLREGSEPGNLVHELLRA